MSTRTTTLAAAIAAITFSMGAAAAVNSVEGAFDGIREASAWDSFVDDSTMSVRLRANHFDLSPTRGKVIKSFNGKELTTFADTVRIAEPDTLKGMFKEVATGIQEQLPPDVDTKIDQLKGGGAPDSFVIPGTGGVTFGELKGMNELQKLLSSDGVIKDDALFQKAIAGIAGNEALVKGINKQLSEKVTKEVEDEGDVRQGGVAVWTHFKSGYLFDFIGFDLGTQSAKMLYNVGSGTKISDRGWVSGNTADRTMSRVAIANVKMRIGDEDRHIGFRKGKIQFDNAHFGRDANEWLLDKNYKGAIVNGKWDGLNVFGMEVTEYADINKKKFITIKDKGEFKKAGFKKTNSVGARYESDYGNLWTQSTWSKNYMRTNLIGAESGIPLSMLGMDVPAGADQDYMIVLSGRYNWQKAKKKFVINNINLPKHKATALAFMAGLKYDALFVATSYLKISKKGFYDAGIGGGGHQNILAGETLINDWNRPNQQTITGLISYDWKNFGMPGLSTNLISAHSSKIDKDQVLKNGDLAFYLSGQDSFHETLLDARYTWQEGPLEGLNVRIVGGAESNQAALKGFGAFLTYDAVLF